MLRIENRLQQLSRDFEDFFRQDWHAKIEKINAFSTNVSKQFIKTQIKMSSPSFTAQQPGSSDDHIIRGPLPAS